MKIVELWTVKAKNLIRDIITGDVNNDDEQEVIISSWDEKVYCINGLNGSRRWVSKYPSEIGGPAERLSLVNLDGKGKKFVAVSMHKNLVILDGETGLYETHIKTDGWIKTMISEDIDSDGFDEFIILTRSGKLTVLDDDFSTIFQVSNLGFQTPYSLSVIDFNYDGNFEIIVGGKELSIYDITGDVLVNKKTPGFVASISSGNISNDGTLYVVFVYEHGIGAVRWDGKVILHKVENLKPYLVDTADIDGDGVQEIIVSDWRSDSIMYYKYTQKKTFRRASTVKLGANVLSLAHGDLDGDGKEEIACILEKINLGLCIMKGSRIVGTRDSYPASLGLRVSDATGFSNADLIVRSGRESVSLLISVPRISLYEPIIKGKEFKISTASIGSSRLLTGSIIDIQGKERYHRVRFSSQGYLIMNRFITIPKNAGTAKIILKQNSKIIAQTQFEIASDAYFDAVLRRVFAYDEDIVSVRNIDDVKSDIPSANLELRNDKIYLSSSVVGLIPITAIIKSNRGGSQKAMTRRVFFILSRAIKATLSRPAIMRSHGFLQLEVENRSRIPLQIWLEGMKNIKVNSSKIVIQPATTAKISAEYKVDIGEYSKDLNITLKVIYAGQRKHELPIGMRTKVINDEKIKELLEELKELGMSHEGKLRILSEKTGVSEGLIEELYSDLLNQ